MDNLICHTANCEHNVKSRCIAGIINISDSGTCTSKMKRAGGVLAQTFADIEASEDFGILDSNKTNVTCDCVKCMHNESRICAADHIVVEDGFVRTKCFTKNVKK